VTASLATQPRGLIPASCSTDGTVYMPDAACDPASVEWCRESRCSGSALQCPDARTVTPGRSHTFIRHTQFTHFIAVI